LGTALALREAQMSANKRVHNVQVRADHRIAAERSATARIRERMKGTVDDLFAMATEQPVVAALSEAGGMLAESVLRVKAPKAQPYAGVAGLIGETIAVYEMATGAGHKPHTVTMLNLAAGVGRGLRARQTLRMIDTGVDSLFK
jgi:hypothetical protein